MSTTIGHERAAGTPAVDLEILRTRLIACTGELATVLAHAAPIAEISQVRDFCVAIATGSGQIVAIDNPLRLGSMAQTVAGIVDYFEFDLKDGDIVLTNDPHRGGIRVQDLTLLTPLAMDSELLLHLVVRVPVRDLGGQVGGNLNPGATEILAEGVPVSPIKIQRMGRPTRDVLTTFLLNGRRPNETRRVIEAASATLALGRSRLAELVGTHGSEAIRAGLAHALAYSEQLARTAIAGWHPGTRTAARALGDDPGGGGPLTVRLSATVGRETLLLDFTDTDDQRPSFVNSPSGATADAALRAVLAVLGDAVPANSGLLRAVEVRTRPGSATHPVDPAPVGWGVHHCGNEVTEAVAAALREAVPTPLPALTVPRPLVLSRPATDRGDQTDLTRWGVGGASATPGHDGWGGPALTSRAELPSAEQWEIETGTRIERLEYAADTSGAGQWAGAPGVEAVIGLLPGHEYTLWTRTAARSVDGLDGGVAGGSGAVDGGSGAVVGGSGAVAFHTPQGWRPAPAVAVEEPVAADRLRLRLPGGGGYGPPGARDRAAVLSDLADGLITPGTARDVYGIDPTDPIDPAQHDDYTRQEGGARHG
ncbi:hydantoinase B/oxoprolinase family protein [Streptomyces sp. NPDC056716]|uniref:hydantoinase B/oxoprolinase family protein n=1 Tax=unclassified Streptomyces TaxID=2593676 RepID=UPI0036808203